MRRFLTAVGAAVAFVAAAALPQPAGAEPVGPPSPSFGPAFLYSLAVPEAEAPGTNDWSCRPTAAHPRPVVLVHGTWENRYDNFARMAPELKGEGYCLFALNYGDDENSLSGIPPAFKGTSDIRQSARELDAFVDQVLATTGAAQVDIVGHSQGGMMPRQYLRFEGGANPADPSQNKVRRLVTLGATHHGTTLSGLVTLAETFGALDSFEPVVGTAGLQQARGSEFMTTLNAGGDTEPGIDYTVIATRYDEVTTPYQSTFLTAGPGATVTNITLQDGCPIDFSDHLSMSYDLRAIHYVKNALDPARASTLPGRLAPCLPQGPVL
jgi:triacylglycerol esterase/lipase EstA (alpha/beta hydrolase family)